MNNIKIMRCTKCGRISIIVKDSEGEMSCCNQSMEELVPASSEELEDTHLPVIARKDGRLYAYAGAYEHPSTVDHYISFMILETEDGYRIQRFQPGTEAKMQFYANEPVCAVYVYCTVHGLWKTEI